MESPSRNIEASLEALKAYAAELDKLAARYRVEDAVAYGLMKQARAMHLECQDKLARINALQDSISAEIEASKSDEDDGIAF